MSDLAERRAVAGAIRNVITRNETIATAVRLSPTGYWMIRAYDSEVYVVEGNNTGNFSQSGAARLDPNDEPMMFLATSDESYMTYQCASGGSVKFIYRERGQ